MESDYTIYVGPSLGQFCVLVCRNSDHKAVSTCSGCRTMERAEAVAQDYYWSFGRAPIVYVPEANRLFAS